MTKIEITALMKRSKLMGSSPILILETSVKDIILFVLVGDIRKNDKFYKVGGLSSTAYPLIG
jgi:hypothetical protein